MSAPCARLWISRGLGRRESAQAGSRDLPPGRLRMGVGCHNCVYVGDHPVNDIEGARRAGMRPIYINAFDGPLHPENVTEIHTLSELTEIF